jgi:Ser/Thr protein kinase RdoA (MazF antagonist)
MLRRALGPDAEVVGAERLPWGSYNTTLRVDLVGGRDPVVVRLAPPPRDQLGFERLWLRSEYVATPHLARLGPLVPRVLGADFTHELVDRDYLVQSLLPGVPAPDRLPAYDPSVRPGFFRQLGALTRLVHASTGQRFGPVHQPCATRWSEALAVGVAAAVADLGSLGAPTSELATLGEAIERHADRLDVVGTPRLLHGDLWSVNVLLDPDAAVPTVVGVVDADRAWWGDPLADWAVYRAEHRDVDAERTAFFDGYGDLEAGPHAEWRRHLYRGWHLVASAVECARLGRPADVERARRDLAEVLAEL